MPVEQFPPSAGTGSWGESDRLLRLSSTNAGQHLLSNTNKLANTSAADEEVHLDARKRGRMRTESAPMKGTLAHRRKREVDWFNDE